MKHTFLFQEGIWIVRGAYYNDRDRALPLEGETKITHREGVWLNEGEMMIRMDDHTIKLNNRYEIMPFEAGNSMTVWESLNADIGPLRGKFVVVDDAIISTCLSEEGKYAGTEVFIKVDYTRYRSRGVLFRGSEKLSSWSVDLRKMR
jgi:hypothetical protein